MNDNLGTQKAELRTQMQQRLRTLTVDDRESLSEEICERILLMEKWHEARNVVLFTPLPSEPIITPLKLDCEARKVTCATMPQSSKTEVHFPDPIDLILVPGLAFSKDRHRLGRGGAFFDRLLAGRAKDAFKLGICFSFQVLDSVPTEAHDIVMDALVTDQAAI